MGGILHEVLFHLMNCGKENLILGMPWLEKENPIIGWKGKIVEIKKTTDHTTSLNDAYTAAQGFLINGIEGLTYPKLLPQDLKREDPVYPDEHFTDYIQKTIPVII